MTATKRRLIVSIPPLLALLFCFGCASLQSPGAGAPGLDGKPKQTLTLAGVFLVTTFRGAVLKLGSDAVKRDPDAYDYMAKALDLVNGLIDKNDFDPLALRRGIEAIPMKEINSPWGQVAIETAVSLYEAYGQQAVDDGIENNLIALKLLEAGRDSLIGILADKPLGQRQGRGVIAQDGVPLPLVATVMEQ